MTELVNEVVQEVVKEVVAPKAPALNLKVKEFEVQDGRRLAKFLAKTGLKKTLFDVLFPQDNPNTPKNWAELRKHLQEVYGWSDAEFFAFQKLNSGNLSVALQAYLGDFPDTSSDMGEVIISSLIDIFAEDVKYEAFVELLAYMFSVEDEVISKLKIAEAFVVVKSLLKDSGFLELWPQSTPQTEMVAETTSL